MKKLIGTIPKESGFISKFRQHQGWWRAFVLNEPEGRYWDKNNKQWKQVCNRINDGEKSLKNFLSKDIADEVQLAQSRQKEAGKGIMETDRLYNNLLSSQPLAFNFFGFFRANKDIALAFLQTQRPDIIGFDDILFEYAPKSSRDRSAFDFGFVVRSFRRKGSKVNYGDKSIEGEDKNYEEYHKIYKEHPDRFQTGYTTYVKESDFNQLFRNEILAVKLLTDYDFVITGLFCHHDDGEAYHAGKKFQKTIGNCESDFIVMTYADYFETMQKLELPWHVRELVMMLWARYCGLELSANILGNKKK